MKMFQKILSLVESMVCWYFGMYVGIFVDIALLFEI